MSALQSIISKRSNYTAHDPYWITLRYVPDADKKTLSKFLLEFFNKYGPDAADDFESCESCDMSYNTVTRAVKYAIKKGKVKEVEPNDLIDGGFSVESDGRRNDPVSGRLLHCIPINKGSVTDELQCILDQDDASHDDWVFLDFVYNSFGDSNDKILRLIRDVIIKHW